MSKLRCILVLAILISTSACFKPKEFKAPKENALRLWSIGKLVSLDPHLTSDTYSAQAQNLVYDTLYEYHFLKRPLTLVPSLAESLPQVSKDRKRLTIRLKKGVHFQDDSCFAATNGKGREITADDVVYTFHRVAAPKFQGAAYSFLDGHIAGITEYHSGKSPNISGVKKVDDYTVEIQLTHPLPRFIYNFADSRVAIVPREAVETYGDKLATHAVGSGPYKIVEANLGSKIVAVRNPTYRENHYPGEGMPGDKEKGLLTDAGKPVPFIDKVVIEVITEAQPAWLKFMSGDLDRSTIPKDVTAIALPDGKLSPELAKLGVQHHRSPRADVVLWIFNMKDPVWGKKKELRQAFALALDVPKVLEVQYSGQAIRAHSLVDPTQVGYDPAFKSRWATRDLKKAKELLAKAGYPDGKGLPPLEMPTFNNTLTRHLDELVTRQVAEVGIVLQPKPMTWPELMRTKKEGRFAMMGMAFASTIPDVDDGTSMLQSKNLSPGSNSANYINPEVDKLVAEIEQMDNGPARSAKIKRLKETVDEDLPYLPMAHRIGNQLAHSWLKNYIFVDEMVLGQFVKYFKIQTAEK